MLCVGFCCVLCVGVFGWVGVLVWVWCVCGGVGGGWVVVVGGVCWVGVGVWVGWVVGYGLKLLDSLHRHSHPRFFGFTRRWCRMPATRRRRSADPRSGARPVCAPVVRRRRLNAGAGEAHNTSPTHTHTHTPTTCRIKTKLRAGVCQ